MLDLGEGVTADPREAFQWISRAADQGSPRALVSLGVLYATGRGVAQDFARSMFHYRAAARLGQAHGFYGVGVLYAHGQGVETDPQESLAWMLCAATLGDGDAQSASEQYHLDSTATFAAAERANAIFAEFGITGHRVQFRDLDAERRGGRTT
jgi:TPR repeat protein